MMPPVRTVRPPRQVPQTESHSAAARTRYLKVKPLTERSGLPEAGLLQPFQVERSAVLGRFDQGATSAEVAREFGLTDRQARGFRILHMRAQDPSGLPSPETVVRYLRRQGDVIVGTDQNHFLVNGRFEMTFEELVDRANRILAREGRERFGSVR
jgi:transposase-like protein